MTRFEIAVQFLAAEIAKGLKAGVRRALRYSDEMLAAAAATEKWPYASTISGLEVWVESDHAHRRVWLSHCADRWAVNLLTRYTFNGISSDQTWSGVGPSLEDAIRKVLTEFEFASSEGRRQKIWDEGNMQKARSHE